MQFMIRIHSNAKFYHARWLTRGIKTATKQSYTKTVLLPQTNFPARHGGRKRVEMDNYLIEVSFCYLYAQSHKLFLESNHRIKIKTSTKQL